MADMTEKTPTRGTTFSWLALHIVGSIIFVLGALFEFVDMNLIPGVPASSMQAWLMMAVGLVLDFWGVIEMRRIQLKRKAAAKQK